MSMEELSEVHGRPWDDVDVSLRSSMRVRLSANPYVL